MWCLRHLGHFHQIAIHIENGNGPIKSRINPDDCFLLHTLLAFRFAPTPDGLFFYILLCRGSNFLVGMPKAAVASFCLVKRIYLLKLHLWHLNELQLRNASALDRKSTRLNSSHANISYAVFCLK